MQSEMGQYELEKGKRAWGGSKTCHSFTGYAQSAFGSNPWGLVLRCVAQDDIPCTLEDRKAMDVKTLVVRMTILRISNIGWGKAPKKLKGGKEIKDPNAKPLFEELCDGATYGSGHKAVSAVRVYNFKKTFSPLERGDRVDDCTSVLYVGETVSTFLSDFMYNGERKRFPAGMSVIPHGSIVEVVVNPSSDGEGLDKGYGLKVSQVLLHSSSLYSYAVGDSLGLFPSTVDEGRNFLAKCLENGPQVRMCIDSTNVTLFGTVLKGSYTQQVSEELEWIKVTNDNGQVLSGVPDMDIHPDDLMRCLNCPGDLVMARTLLDFAAAMGALKGFVYESKYFAKNQPLLSHYRFFPVIDVNVLFADIKADEIPARCTCMTVPLPACSMSGLGSLQMRVMFKGLSHLGDDYVPVPTRDFSLVSGACTFESGYKVQVVETTEGESNCILEMFFVASFANKGGSGSGAGRTAYVKRSFAIMNEEEEDEEL